MGREANAFFGHLPDVGEGKDLKSAGVGEDGSVPAFEAVQSACLMEDLSAGTEVEVVGVTEDDLRFDVVFEFLPLHTLDGTYGTDGHEDRREDIAMVGMDDTGSWSDAAIAIFQFKKGHSLLLVGKTIDGLKVFASSGVRRA